MSSHPPDSPTSTMSLATSSRNSSQAGDADYAELHDEAPMSADDMYQHGVLLYKEKKYKEAEAAIIDMGKNFEGYDFWRARSFILLADVYVGMNEKVQAKATLNSIIENSDDKEAMEMAKEKLNKIEK